MQAFAQVIISDQMTTTPDKLDAQIELFLNSEDSDKTVVMPYVGSNTSVADMKDGMFAYHTGKECFVYYKEGWISDCIVDNKRAYAQSTSFTANASPLLAPTTFRELLPTTTGNVLTLTKKSMVRVVLNASHQYYWNLASQSGCAAAELALYMNGDIVKSIYHQSDATNIGNIYPLSIVYIAVLNPGTYTFQIYERTINSCATNKSNRFVSPSISISYKQVF